MKYVLLFILTFGGIQSAMAGDAPPPLEFAHSLDAARGALCTEKPYVYLTSDAFGSKPAKPPYGMYICTTRLLTGEDADWISEIKSIGADVSLQLIASPARPLN